MASTEPEYILPGDPPEDVKPDINELDRLLNKSSESCGTSTEDGAGDDTPGVVMAVEVKEENLGPSNSLGKAGEPSSRMAKAANSTQARPGPRKPTRKWTQLSREKRERCVELMRQGYSMQSASEVIGCTAPTTRRWWNRWKKINGWKPSEVENTGSTHPGTEEHDTGLEQEVQDASRKDGTSPQAIGNNCAESIRIDPFANRHPGAFGRRRSTAKEDDARIVEYVLQHPLSTAAVVKKELCLDCSVALVRRRMRDGGVFGAPSTSTRPSCVARTETPRVLLASVLLQHQPEQWRRVVFSDERTFTVKKGSLIISRRRDYRQKSHQKSPRSVRVWTWIDGEGRGSLLRTGHAGASSPAAYRALLESQFLPAYDELRPDRSRVLLHLRDWPRTLSLDGLLEAQPRLQLVRWCPRPNEHNPIDQVWEKVAPELRSALNSRSGTVTSEEIWEMLQSAWEQHVTPELCARHVDSLAGSVRAQSRTAGPVCADKNAEKSAQSTSQAP